MTTDTSAGVTERELEVSVNGRRVPTVLWTPAGVDAPVPLVLVGHGGSGHKRHSVVVSMAHGLVTEHGIAALAIDGPVNGDREENDDGARALREADRDAYRRRYYVAKYDQMVEDWQAALTVAQAQPEVGTGPVGYWGVSMGTRFGLPLVVAEPRITVAVLGLFGLKPGVEVNQRVYDDAPRLRTPVLFLQQLDDQQIDRTAYADLFDLLGTDDRRLHANLGGHAEIPEDEYADSRRFLARRLAGQRV
ncbi:MAG: hypothetical protein AMXMBFR23_07220 [Chloroflexota bacterium]